ncbi:MAG: hypothetical protein M0P95_14720 [Sulfuritalea sp.]|nr:hypothetical protein [Sulfuritalea sp.]
MRKMYLAVFLLPKPMPEHKGIVEVIRTVSGGDFKSAFVGSGAIGYVFTSEHLPWQIKFPRIIMNNDSFFISEIGKDFAHQNLGGVEGWLKSHLHNK